MSEWPTGEFGVAIAADGHAGSVAARMLRRSARGRRGDAPALHTDSKGSCAMGRRIAVPDVAGLARPADAVRVNPLLAPPDVAPVYERRLQPLDGVTWPHPTPPAPMPGEVPMFDLPDPGELQHW